MIAWSRLKDKEAQFIGNFLESNGSLTKLSLCI